MPAGTRTLFGYGETMSSAEPFQGVVTETKEVRMRIGEVAGERMCVVS